MVDLIRSQKWHQWKRKSKKVKNFDDQISVNEALVAVIENQHDIIDMQNSVIRKLGTSVDYLNGVVIPIVAALCKDEAMLAIVKANMPEEQFKRLFDTTKHD
jgi:hypothetical protein